MESDSTPLCMRHEEFVVMKLATIHTEAGRPDAIGKYECPVCGAEQRRPLELGEQGLDMDLPGLAPPAVQEA